MRTRSVLLLGCILLLVAGCHKKKPAELDLSAVFPNLPLPPGGQLLAEDKGTDAIRLTVLSPAAPDTVVGYYRAVLSNDPFRLINEQRSGKVTSFYAEQNGPSLWITVSPNGTDGSQVLIAGGRDIPAAAKKP